MIPGSIEPAPRPHHQAFEWRQTHGRVHRPSPIDRRHGAATPEMRDDHGELVGRTMQELRRATHRPRHGQTVEAEAADARLRAPRRRHRVADGRLGQRRVEGGIEGGHVRDSREARPSGAHGPRSDGIVERRQVAQCLDRCDRRSVEKRRPREPLAAVDDPIADGVDRAVGEDRVDRRDDRPRPLGPQVHASVRSDPGAPVRRRHDGGLERRRARVQDEDTHGPVVSASSASR